MWYFANNRNIKVVIMELYRSIIEELKTWKRNPGRKPLILKGLVKLARHGFLSILDEQNSNTPSNSILIRIILSMKSLK